MTTLIALFCCFENEFKKSCLLCRNFISIYKINRTLHGRLGIRILSSHAESISHSFTLLTRERYFQHEKIKFVPPSGHVISSISSLKYLSPACNLQIICTTYYMLKHGMMCIYSIFKANPFSYIMLSTKNAVKFFKPFCCLLLLSGSSHPLVSTTEVQLDELLKQLQKWKKEGEYIMHV